MGPWMFGLALGGLIMIFLFSLMPNKPAITRNDRGPMAVVPTGLLVLGALAVFVCFMLVILPGVLGVQ